MSDKQRTAFDQWFDSELDPEINLTLEDKELCRQAWTAALSHAEGEAGWRSGYPGYDGDGGVCHIPLDGHPDFMVVAFNSDGDLVDSCGDDVGYSLEDVERWRPIDAPTAPQVAVPEAVKERVVEAIAEALGDAKDCIRVWTAWGVGTMGPDDFLDVAGDPDRLDEIAEAAITAMLAAAPTAPAGEKHPDDTAVDRFAAAMKAKLAKKRAEGRSGWDDKERCSQEFLSRLLRNHVGKGDPVDVANLAMMLHQRGEVIQQPVSDPDGLTEPGRREAEQAYINCAFDYARDPIGSRDWFLFWNGWRARNAAPAPDDREIAARALEEFRTGPLRSACLSYGWDTESDAYIVDRMLDEEASLLRAGKEGSA